MKTNLAIKTSKIRRYKNAFYSVSLILIFAISIGMAFAPTASAQPGVSQPITSTGYISVAPLLIGVGQRATVNLWIAPLPTGYSGSPWYGPPPGFTGVSVTFTRPDGTKDTFMPTDPFGNYLAGETEALGTLTFSYAPNMAGNWSITTSMPAQNFTDASGTVTYTACTSAPAYFSVTTQAQNAGLLNGWPFSPLPNSNAYWTNPISPNNREWASVTASLWPPLDGGYWQPYGSAPSTSHILWQVQGGLGGIIGGDVGDLALQGSGTMPIILLGKVYISGINNLGGFNCYDLTTGKLLYSSNNTITNAIILPGNPYSQSAEQTQASGVILAGSAAPTANLFGTSVGAKINGVATTNWNYINPLTGLITTQLTNVTSGITTIMTDYSPLVYGSYMSGQTTTPPYYMKVNYVFGWNLTKVVGNDWYTGLMWMQNVTRHWGGVNDPGPGDGIGRAQGFVVSADMSTIAIGGSAGNFMAKGFSTTDGHSVWNDSLGYVGLSSSNGVVELTNYFVTAERPGIYRCYSILTGALQWTTTTPGTGSVWDSQEYDEISDANNIFVPSPGGTISALSIATGAVSWTSTPIPSTEYVTNAIPIFNIGHYHCGVAAGGLLYVYAGYSSSYTQEPIPRFAECICLNATTGATVWTLNGGPLPNSAYNGYLFTTSQFSGMISCIGKGQTSTSVTVPNNVNEGVRVQIQGNVLDQSPAQAGTPAVSDSSMSEQMDFLHMQNATLLNNPPKEQGVPVTLTTVDPNNNTVTIGTTTTDSKGNFYFNWTPTTTGTYTITATFAGSNSYWPSNSETGTVVNAAPTTTAGTSTTTTSSGISDTALYAGIAAVIVVIVIVGAVLGFLVLRKRP